MKRHRPALLIVVAPYLWLAAFFFVPFLIVLKISLSQVALAQPPYLPILDLAAGWRGLRDFFGALSFDGYVLLFSDPLYLFSYLKSLIVAAAATAILLLVPDRLCDCPRAATAAAHPRHAHRTAVLDLLPHPHLRLDQHLAARRSPE